MKYLFIMSSLLLTGCMSSENIAPIQILTQPEIIIIPKGTELTLIGNEKYTTTSNEVYYSEGYVNKAIEEFKKKLAE